MAQSIMVRGATGGPELTGDALAINVLQGKTFYNTDDNEKITGALPLNAVLNTYGGTLNFYDWTVTPINSNN